MLNSTIGKAEKGSSDDFYNPLRVASSLQVEVCFDSKSPGKFLFVKSTLIPSAKTKMNQGRIFSFSV